MANQVKVYRSARGRFYVQLCWHGQVYRRYHYDLKWSNMPYREMAERIAHAMNADLEKRGPAFDPRQWFKTPGYEFQFSRLVENWLEDNQLSYAPSVRRDVARYCGIFTEHFQETDIREIRKTDLKQLVKSFPSTWGPKTKKNALTLLHKLFADAKDDELIDKLPGFPTIEVPEPEVKWITLEWQEKILAAIPEKDRPIFQFIAAWGIRPGEARALKWDCVDFEKEIITIRRTFSGAGCNHLEEFTKTRRIRFLPFTDTLRSTFKGIRGLGGFVFRNHKGRAYTADISRLWNEARDRVGAPKVTLYQGTRHSFATQHLDKLDLVRQVFGHTRSDMTRKYQGLNLDKIKGLVAKPSSIINGVKG